MGKVSTGSNGPMATLAKPVVPGDRPWANQPCCVEKVQLVYLKTNGDVLNFQVVVSNDDLLTVVSGG